MQLPRGFCHIVNSRKRDEKWMNRECKGEQNKSPDSWLVNEPTTTHVVANYQHGNFINLQHLVKYSDVHCALHEGWRCLLHRLNRLPLAALKKTNLKILRSIMAGISVPTSQQTRWHATMLGRAVRHVNRWADSKPSLVLGRLLQCVLW